MRDCRKCKHGFAYFAGMPTDEDDVMECRWEPDSPLPYSWRFVRREVVSVHPYDADQCEAYKPRWSNDNG